MDIGKIPPGENPPHDINVVIEIPGGAGGGSPVKYEIDKESGALFVDRIVNVPMFYPNNYGFVPNTLHEEPVLLQAVPEELVVADRAAFSGVGHQRFQTRAALPARTRSRSSADMPAVCSAAILRELGQLDTGCG